MRFVIPTIHSERRRAARFAARLPIQVSEIGTGSTIDISASGVSFVIDRPIQPGQVIRFQLTLDDEPGGPFEIQCEGVVGGWSAEGSPCSSQRRSTS